MPFIFFQSPGLDRFLSHLTEVSLLYANHFQNYKVRQMKFKYSETIQVI
ncbi:hypothetical protein Pan241w_30350 [Gimesia alba]|uniref:Uncharacterized protein n=1 Tax=Gimesia alba TaxID=2527973 RepID=A0A517RGF3_9PLAN|nr:hypothetical protein Pan241w_30350 [Gimesia alba]